MAINICTFVFVSVHVIMNVKKNFGSCSLGAIHLVFENGIVIDMKLID